MDSIVVLNLSQDAYELFDKIITQLFSYLLINKPRKGVKEYYIQCYNLDKIVSENKGALDL